MEDLTYKEIKLQGVLGRWWAARDLQLWVTGVCCHRNDTASWTLRLQHSKGKGIVWSFAGWWSYWNFYCRWERAQLLVNPQLRLEWKVVKGTRADTAKLCCFDPCQLGIWVFDELWSPIGISSSCCWSQNITCSDFFYPGIAQEVDYLSNKWSCLEVLHPALANCLVHVFVGHSRMGTYTMYPYLE